MTAASTPVPDLPAGLAGYTLIRPLEAGGMAEVFAATQESLGRQVAIKVMKEGDASLGERFQREARLVATLNHPNIVHIYDVGRLADGRPYLSMELLPGGDLRSRIRAGLSNAQALRILRQLAQGLQAVHARGIVHRDIKPANILFRENGDAVLTDFGIAKAVDIDTELTQVGVVVGSPAYSSPEQVRARPLDARSDLYSLGVVLLEMLTGRNPFRGEDYAATVVNQLQLEPPRLPTAQAAWQPLLDRLLAKAPEQRFADAGALLAALPGGSTQAASAVAATGPARSSIANQSAAADLDRTVVSGTVLPATLPQRLLAALTVLAQRLGAWLARPEHRQKLGAGLTWLLRSLADGLMWMLTRLGRWLAQMEPGRRGRLLGVLFVALVAAGVTYHLTRDPQVKRWLEQADARMEQNRLSQPDGDNAVFYYQLVLARDPGNRRARHGLEEVAERFADLAREARESGNLREAREYVARGLEARPGDEDLLGLDEELRAAARGQRGRLRNFIDSVMGR